MPQDRIGSVLALQQTVDPLQLTLGQDETVDLLLPARTRYHDATHQHRVRLLLLLCLQRRCVPAGVPFITLEGMIQQCAQSKNGFCAFTLTNKVEGNVAKSEEARAPRCWWTMCAATSSCQKRVISLQRCLGGESADDLITFNLVRVSLRDCNRAVCSSS